MASAATHGRSVFRDWDLWLVGLLVLGALGGACLLSPLGGYLPSERSEALVECLQGSCWVRRQGQLQIYLVPVGQPVRASMGDEVMTLGSGSGLVVNFADKSGEIFLQQTGIARIAKGRRRVRVDENSEGGVGGGGLGLGASSGSHSAQGQSSLVYVGEVALTMSSPVSGVPIIGLKFPMRLHVGFSTQSTDVDLLTRLQRWTLVKYVGDALQPVGSFDLVRSSNPSGVISYYGEVMLPHEGRFGLLPASLNVEESNVAVRFPVRSGDALETQIHDLLKGVSSPDGLQLEIRSD